MVGRPSCRLRLDATKPELSQIKLIDKGIDRSGRIVIAQIVIHTLREQNALAAIIANNKARHRIPRQITEESYQPRRFHTAWTQIRHHPLQQLYLTQITANAITVDICLTCTLRATETRLAAA
jgi:hypothetical protein